MKTDRAIYAVLIPLLTVIICHCNSNSSDSPAETSEAMIQTDNPDLIPGLSSQAARTLTDLPASGQIRTKIWRGYWWPLRRGGMLQRTAQNGPSPIEKYDQALGLDNKAVAWEKDFNGRFGNVHWAGFCNGLAAAAMMTKEPIRAVNYRNIVFAPSDIKALLVRIWNTSGRTVGGRCNHEHELLGENGRETNRSCRDINPATLHLSLTNFIGRFGIPIILDQTAYAEIWNFPVISYSSKSVEVSKTSASQTIDATSGQSYLWNPSAENLTAPKLELCTKPLRRMTSESRIDIF